MRFSSAFSKSEPGLCSLSFLTKVFQNSVMTWDTTHCITLAGQCFGSQWTLRAWYNVQVHCTRACVFSYLTSYVAVSKAVIICIWNFVFQSKKNDSLGCVCAALCIQVSDSALFFLLSCARENFVEKIHHLILREVVNQYSEQRFTLLACC